MCGAKVNMSKVVTCYRTWRRRNVDDSNRWVSKLYLLYFPFYPYLNMLYFGWWCSFLLKFCLKKALHSYEVNFSHAHNTKMTLRERRRKNNCPILWHDFIIFTKLFMQISRSNLLPHRCVLLTLPLCVLRLLSLPSWIPQLSGLEPANSMSQGQPPLYQTNEQW